MVVSKFIKRPDGTLYRLDGRFVHDSRFKAQFEYTFSVFKAVSVGDGADGASKLAPVYDFDRDLEFKKMRVNDRKWFAREKYLEFVTIEEVNEVFTQLYYQLKPEFITDIVTVDDKGMKIENR